MSVTQMESEVWRVVKTLFLPFLFSSFAAVPTLQAWQLLLFQVPLDSTRLSTARPLGGSMACYPPPTLLSMRRCWCQRWSPSYPTSAWSSCGARRLQLAVKGNNQDWTLLKTDAESLHSFASITLNYYIFFNFNMIPALSFNWCPFIKASSFSSGYWDFYFILASEL